VRVWLGEDRVHYYVLSRFLVRRMLTAAGIPDKWAVKISLELKRDLVDHDLLSLPQGDLDQRLFRIMEARGYGPEYVRQYEMVVRFFHIKAPLLVLVCGTACVGKSVIATQLSERLNFSHVIQTDILLDLIKDQGYTASEKPLHPTPLWERDLAGPQLLAEYGRECAALRQGLDCIIEKCHTEGKAMVLEGTHLDPAAFLAEDGLQPLGAPPRDPLPRGRQRPLLVPIVLEMAEVDHREMIRDWSKACTETTDAVFERLRTMQDYLLQFEAKGCVNVEVRLDSVSDTIDAVHEFLLSCLEKALKNNGMKRISSANDLRTERTADL